MVRRPTGKNGPAIPTATRVLELSDGTSAAAACGQLLADLGAEVTWIRSGRAPANRPLLAQGKQVRGLSSPAALGDQVSALARERDIVIFDDVWTRRLAPLGLERDPGWRRAAPGAVVCSFTPFGQGNEFSGWRGGELAVQAMAAITSINGLPGTPPLRIGLPLLTYATAALGCAAVLAAVHQRRATGEGQFIDMAAFDAGLLLLGNFLPTYVALGEIPQKTGSRHPALTPFTTYPTSDGMATVCAISDGLWNQMSKVIGRPELIGDERYNTSRKRTDRHQEVDAIVSAWSRRLPTDEVLRALNAASVPVGPVRTVRDLLADPHLRERGLLMGDPGAGTPERIGSVLRFDSPTGEVLSPRAVQARSGQPAHTTAADKPLSGVRVMEIGAYTTIPLCGRFLADLGAEVIRVIPPNNADWQPARERAAPGRPFFDIYHPGKKCVSVDLSDPRGREVVKRLARHCDVLIENFAVETIEKWGLTYQALREANPRLVYCAMTGFGMGNARTYRRAFDLILQGESGMMSLNGEPDGPPLKTGPSTVDVVGGMVAAAGVVAGLNRRDLTGQGCFVDGAMYDVAAWLTSESWPVVRAGGEAVRTGNRDPRHPLHDIFTARDGASVAVAALSAEEEAAATALFGAATGEPLDAAARRWIGGLDGEEAVRRCQEHGLGAVPALTVPDLIAHPLTRARQMVVHLPPANGAGRATFGTPFKFGRGPSLAPSAGWAENGAHTDEVLAGLLGLSNYERAALAAAGITALKPHEGAARA